MSNKEKNIALGMPYGTARNRLTKELMFEFCKRLEMDTCYQCKGKIRTVEELSIEHKVPWLHSDNPLELFFDLGNIAFSHLSCNSSAARRKQSSCGTTHKYSHFFHGCRCDDCRSANRLEWNKRKDRVNKSKREKRRSLVAD